MSENIFTTCLHHYGALFSFSFSFKTYPSFLASTLKKDENPVEVIERNVILFFRISILTNKKNEQNFCRAWKENRKLYPRKINWVNSMSAAAATAAASKQITLISQWFFIDSILLRGRKKLGEWKHLYWIGNKFWWLRISELYSIFLLPNINLICS